jgi:hypothetical protein
MWPFDEDDPRSLLQVSRMFADGFATVYPDEDIDEVVVRDIRVSSNEVSFAVYKVKGGESVSSNSIAARIDRERPYATAVPSEAGWSAFVLDVFQVLQNDGMSFPGPFRMSDSSLYARANRVLSFTLVNGEERSGKISGNVKFKAGTNMYVGSDILQASYIMPITEDKKGVVISAIPGAGAGRVPCEIPVDCGEGSGNIKPDEMGDVVFEGDDCHQIVPVDEPWTDESGIKHVSVKIIGKCTACCQCDDYVDIGNRLAGESERLSDVYSMIKRDSSVYNAYARKFNQSVYRVSADELLVHCVAMSQNRNVGSAHSVNMGSSGISGSIDRANASLTIKNTSICDVSCTVYAQMDPQRIVMATIIRPTRSDDTSTSVVSETIDCSNMWYDDPSNDCCDPSNDCYDPLNPENCDLYDAGPAFFKSGVDVPSGSSVNIILYGSKANTTTPNRECKVNGFVTFSWMERDPYGSNDTVPRQLVRKFSAEQRT